MDTIGGIEIFPLISFLIFFLFFIVLFTWVIRMKKNEVDSLAQLPLEDESQEKNT
jgi:cbb3-type cytochrome oxidase subunit 3